MVEFALVLPILMLVVGGIIQFGVLFWTQNTLVQATRDLARWEATQSFNPCSNVGSSLWSEANTIASQSSLLGYSNSWNATNFIEYADNTALPSARPFNEGIEAVWSLSNGTDACPPSTNATAWFVTIRTSHMAPTFFPFVPAISLTTTTQFRMEPVSQP